MEERNERSWIVSAHLASALGCLLPGGTMFGPLVVWLISPLDSPGFKAHVKSVLNYQINIFIVAFVLALLFFSSSWGIMAVHQQAVENFTKGVYEINPHPLLVSILQIVYYASAAVFMIVALASVIVPIISAIRLRKGRGAIRYPGIQFFR